MTEVISLEAKFKSTGAKELAADLAQMSKSAAQLQKEQLKAGQDYFASQRMQATAMREMNREFENRRKAALTMFPAFEKAKNSVGQWATANAALLGGLGVAAGAIYGAGKAAAASYMEFQNYAGSVRDLSAISGTGAEETSRFIQVLDDFQISAQDVTTATKAMTKQGLAPTVETLAKLADQYKAIQDPMERNAFVLKNLGKGGLNWVNALNQGGDALRSMGSEVNKNLILTDKQIEMSEQSRLAIDAWTDAIQGIKVAFGSMVGSQIVASKTTRTLEAQFASLGLTNQTTGNRFEHSNTAFDRFRKTMEKGSAMTAFYTAQQKGMNAAAGIYIETEEEKEKRMSMTLSGGLQLTQMQVGMRAKSLELNTALTEQTAILEKLRKQGYSETGTKIQNQIETVNQLKNAVTQNNAAQTQSYQVFASSILAAKDASLEQQLAYAVASGQITQGAMNQQMAQDELSNEYMKGGITAATYASNLQRLMDKVSKMDGKTASMYIKIFIKEYGGGSNALALIAQQAGSTANVQVGNVASSGGKQKAGGAFGDGMDGKATGGQLGNNWTLVGDRPGGQFVNGVSELISPTGYVYDAKTSKQILESGMLNGVQSRAESGELGGGGAISKPRVTRTSISASSPNARRSIGAGGGVSGMTNSLNVSGEAIVASNQETAAQTAQQTAALQQQMTQYINQQMAGMQNGFQMLAGVLQNDNPRAIGAAVSTEFAKLS